MKRILSSVLAVLLAAALACPAFAASAFPDVDEDADYAVAVEYVSEAGLMVGDERGCFDPDQTVTRAEMAVILCNLLMETEDLTTDGSLFSDVPASHWANKYVTRAAELGLVAGYGGGRFGPSDGVKYEQAITMVVNAVYGAEEAIAEGGYPDGYLIAAEEIGLIDGISVQKGDTMSRANIAMLLFNSAYQAGIFEAE